MPVATGPLSLTRFKLIFPKNDLAFHGAEQVTQVAQFLAKNAIDPLALEDTREEALGFCHPFSGEPRIEDIHSLIFQQALLFGLRFDKKKIPLTFMKLQLRHMLENVGASLFQGESGGKKLSKKMRDEVRERLKLELLKSTLPSVKLVEILWHLDSHEVWITSTSQSVITAFESLLKNGLSVHFVRLNAGTLPIDLDRCHLGLSLNIEPLLDVLPTSWMGPRGGEGISSDLSFS